MLRWIVNALASSVGKKIVMSLTGFLLLGFLVNHLAGNLKLYGDESAFDEYVEFLQSFGPLLTFAEIGLAALFLCHIVIAMRLTLENRAARKSRYAVRNHRGAQTFGSISMFATGAIILGFLLKHMYDFRFNGEFLGDPRGVVAATLSQPGTALIYIVASAVLGIHLSHGVRSAAQSIGASHPKLNSILQLAAIPIAAAFAIGFASFPLYFLFLWNA